MKNGEATGPDDIPAEISKVFDETNNDIKTNLCNAIYNNGQIPSEMKQSVFVILPKKPKTQNCAEHRTISFMSHVTNVLLKMTQSTCAMISLVHKLLGNFPATFSLFGNFYEFRNLCNVEKVFHILAIFQKYTTFSYSL